MTFQQWEENQAESGEPEITWSDFVTVWAHMMPMDGTERFANEHLAGERATKIRIRWSSTTAQITEKFRAVYGSRIYDIISILNRNERNKELIIMAKERLSGS